MILLMHCSAYLDSRARQLHRFQVQKHSKLKQLLVICCTARQLPARARTRKEPTTATTSAEFTRSSRRGDE